MKSLGPYQQVERRSPEAKKDLKECRICWSKRQYRTYLRNNLRYMLWPSSRLPSQLDFLSDRRLVLRIRLGFRFQWGSLSEL